MLNIETYYLNELRKGSHDAFTYFYKVYADMLYSFVLMHTRSALIAEEIVQDTFIRIWDNRQSVKTDTSFKSFLFTISKNKIVDEFRRQMNQANFEEYITFVFEEHQENNTADKLLLYEDFLDKLGKAKQELSPQQLRIFDLSREQGYSNKEIASELDLSEQTVKNQLSTAIKKLKDKLKEYNTLFLFFL